MSPDERPGSRPAVWLEPRTGDLRPGLGTGLVKIDGLREPEHAAAAALVGADLLGFIFAPARRQVTAETARAAILAAHETAPDRQVKAVGVFVDAGADEINAVVRKAGLDLVQLHGEEAPELLANVSRPVIKAVRPPLGTAAEEVERTFQRYMTVANAPILFLVDGYAPGAAGGTGIRADWELARILAASWPVTLAGGLDPDNVGAAITAVRPAVVDVSSGIETGGIKDAAKIAGFVANAKRAFAELAAATS